MTGPELLHVKPIRGEWGQEYHREMLLLGQTNLTSVLLSNELIDFYQIIIIYCLLIMWQALGNCFMDFISFYF